MDKKYATMKDQLAKGFKREKAVKNVLAEEQFKLMDLKDKNEERHGRVADRKKAQDIKNAKARREEEAAYKRRMQAVADRRMNSMHRTGGDPGAADGLNATYGGNQSNTDLGHKDSQHQLHYST